MQKQRYQKFKTSRRAALRFVFSAIAGIGFLSVRVSPAQNPVVQKYALQIQKRQVAQQYRTIQVQQGEQVIITWMTDEAVELHLHGYDIQLHLSPGTPKPMIFEARLTGRFPITGHGFGHHTLAYIEVYPR